MNLRFIQVVSFLQMLATAFFSITSFISLFQTSSIYFLFQTTAFVLISSLAILLLNVINNNYPDKPIQGRQKSIFNWLFILNFLLIAFLFGLVFAEYAELHAVSKLINRPVLSLPFELLILFLVYIFLLIFQFVVLYGLYSIRRQIFRNFINKEFEFERNSLKDHSPGL